MYTQRTNFCIIFMLGMLNVKTTRCGEENIFKTTAFVLCKWRASLTQKYKYKYNFKYKFKYKYINAEQLSV